MCTHPCKITTEENDSASAFKELLNSSLYQLIFSASAGTFGLIPDLAFTSLPFLLTGFLIYEMRVITFFPLNCYVDYVRKRMWMYPFQTSKCSSNIIFHQV